MTSIRHFAVSAMKKNFFFWKIIFLIAIIPCILVSAYHCFFTVPRQTFSVSQQKLVNTIAEASKEAEQDNSKITISMDGISGDITIQNGTISRQAQQFSYQVLYFILYAIAMYAMSFFFLFLLYAFSSMLMHPEG